jgi:hypothetical protein
VGFAGLVMMICSLLTTTWGWSAEGLEQQELRQAFDALKKDHERLKALSEKQRLELAVATNRLAEVTGGIRASGMDLFQGAAEEERTAREWRMFLSRALKTLAETDDEIRELHKKLGMLVYATKEAMQSAPGIDPRKRTNLEGELRACESLLEKTPPAKPVLVPAIETAALVDAKVIGVRLDLGVAALEIGAKHGARVGMPFLVVRGEEVLAVLTIAEVREGTALAIIDQMDSSQPIREGDRATLRKG